MKTDQTKRLVGCLTAVILFTVLSLDAVARPPQARALKDVTSPVLPSTVKAKLNTLVVCARRPSAVSYPRGEDTIEFCGALVHWVPNGLLDVKACLARGLLERVEEMPSHKTDSKNAKEYELLLTCPNQGYGLGVEIQRDLDIPPEIFQELPEQGL